MLSQRDIDLEFIVIDGGSTDNTLSILEENKNRIQHLVSEADKGMYDALNKGLSLASGEVIGVLNSDDLYADDMVLKKVLTVFEDTGSDTVYGDLVYVSRTDLSKIIRYWKSGKYETGMFERGWMPPHPAFFVKREVYEKYGYFNLELGSAADYELMLRFIRKAAVSTYYISEVLVKMRVGGISNKSLINRLKANENDLKAWQVNGIKHDWSFRFLKPLSKIKQYLSRPD